jgi:hypothetical protein
MHEEQKKITPLQQWLKVYRKDIRYLRRYVEWTCKVVTAPWSDFLFDDWPCSWESTLGPCFLDFLQGGPFSESSWGNLSGSPACNGTKRNVTSLVSSSFSQTSIGLPEPSASRRKGGARRSVMELSSSFGHTSISILVLDLSAEGDDVFLNFKFNGMIRPEASRFGLECRSI